MAPILTTTLSALPALLLLISFALALASALSPQWAVSSLYDPSTGLLDPNRTHHRSPFYVCHLFQGNTTAAAPTENCTRYGPSGSHTSCSELIRPDNQHMCQQVHLSGNLLIAANLFLGSAMILSIVLIALNLTSASRPRTSKPSITSYLTPITYLITLLCLPMLILAQLLGINALVNDQAPNSDFASADAPQPVTDPTVNGDWYMGKASMIWLSTAWLAAGLAAFVQKFVWEFPQVGAGARAGAEAVDDGSNSLGAPGHQHRHGHGHGHKHEDIEGDL